MSIYLARNGRMLTRLNGTRYFSYISFPLPAYTIRLLYTDGFTPTFHKGTGVQLSSSPNIWDLTHNDPDWYHILEDGGEHHGNHTELLEVLGGNTTGVTDTRGMFNQCHKLRSVAYFDTSAVTSMEGMFRDCHELKDLALIDTSSVTNMNYMLAGCWALNPVPYFNTSNVTNMNHMFAGALHYGAAKTIPLFDTSKVTSMYETFQGCGVKYVPLLDTSSVTDMRGMFYGAAALKEIPLFNTSNVTVMHNAFENCDNVDTGALALYQQASSQVNVPGHIETFKRTGSLSPTGRAEVAQIPDDWK